MTTPPLPEQIELHRDRMWRRDEALRIESAVDAERFIEKKPNRGQACYLCDFQSTNHMGKYYVSQVRLNWYWLRILIPVK